jgi:hypothetical protein
MRFLSWPLLNPQFHFFIAAVALYVAWKVRNLK